MRSAFGDARQSVNRQYGRRTIAFNYWTIIDKNKTESCLSRAEEETTHTHTQLRKDRHSLLTTLDKPLFLDVLIAY
jgi:hypothetical protein